MRVNNPSPGPKLAAAAGCARRCLLPHRRGTKPGGSMISVIISVYNGAHFVAHAIRNALEQTLPPGEVIVVDDGSSDKSAEIAESFGDKVRVLRRRHGGSATALNSPPSLSRGDLVAFNDADDLWTPDKLAFQSRTLAADDRL